jgi:mono/diheme cytochrome c family protein
VTARGAFVIGCVLQLGVGFSVNSAEVSVPAGVEGYSWTGARSQEWPASVPAQEVPIEETYRRQCAACHGEQGRGDGRMARRFKPPPADFQDPEGVAKRTDEELVEVITDGRASMPAFGDVLSEEVVAAVVTYVRDLSRGMDR